jgi:hypothetical protein
MKPDFQVKKYPSAVDAWLAVILTGPPVLIISCGIYAMFAKSVKAGVPIFIIGLAIGALILLFSFPCVYTLGEDRLIIRCGIIKYNVPLSEIVRVEKSGSLWSAPALSTRRVKIETTTGWYLVSPRDREGFIADVTARLRVDTKRVQSHLLGVSRRD